MPRQKSEETKNRFSVNENSFIAKYLSNPRLVIILLILIFTVGLTSLFTLPRTLNPDINIAVVFVTTVLPGAGPKDIESLVTIPLEDAIRSVEKIDTMQSTSQDSASLINIQFQSGVNADKALQDVQTQVNTVTGLPSDVQTPQVQKLDFQNQPVWVFNLTSTKDDGSLFRFAKDLQQKLKDLPEIDSVSINGLEDTEVQVTVNPEVISNFGINPILIQPAISNALKAYPAGYIKALNNTFTLTIDAEATTVDDLRNLVINLNGQNLKLSDIATISEHPKPDQNQSFLVYSTFCPTYQNPLVKFYEDIKQKILNKPNPTCPNSQVQRSVTFNIFKTNTTNIDKAVDVSEDLINQEIKDNEGKFQVSTLINTNEEIDKQYFDLARDFTITILLVMGVLFVFLGARQALVAALSAPLSFLIAFSVMKATGISLNFLSLFSLLLSLGLLVDDTVVVISAVTSYWRKYHLTPLQTGLLVWKDFIIPILTTTTTTVFAFLPLLIATGIIGEFIKSIPIVVSTALTASFLVSLFIVLPLMILFLKFVMPKRVRIFLQVLIFILIIGLFYFVLPKDNNLVLLQMLAFLVLLFIINLVKDKLWLALKNLGTKLFTKRSNTRPVKKTWDMNKILDQGIFSFARIEDDYTKFIENTVISKSNRRKVLIVVITFFIFAMLLVPLGFVKNEFFPKTDQDLVYMNLELPAGTYVEGTKKEALSLLNELKNTKGVSFVTADIGESFSTDQGSTTGSSANNVLFSLIMKGEGLREASSIEVAQSLREKYKDYNAGDLTVQELSGGPPAGADIQIKILGDDLEDLDKYADQIVGYLKTQRGVTNIKKSIEPGTSKITFIPDKSKLAQYNLGIDQVGMWLRTYASGFTLDKIQLDENSTDKTDITFRLYAGSSTAQDLTSLSIPTISGNLPINSLGKFDLETNPTLITREEGQRTISVSAGVTAGTNSQEINKSLEKYADSQLNLAPGYTWKTGGANEQNQESVNSILQAMILSFMLITVTMVIQFSSFRRALIVMLVIPLAASGVFIIFALTGTPLSFPALIGVLALFGIVVKNSILIVDRIVENEKSGMPLDKSIGEASASRLEPIALTSFATIMGLVPITLTDPLWRGLGGAIISGLLFSGTIMLFFIPVVYYLMFKPTEDLSKKRRV
jgi:multidrug efflux pump subunit AcrB